MSVKNASVCVIGAGAAGLITAHTLSQDGFDVHVLTRDRSPGGVWAKQRVYPGLAINNVYGEFRFSAMPMPPPANESATGGRLSGDDMQQYMESFADKFLRGKIRYEVEVMKVIRSAVGQWTVKVQDIRSGEEELHFDKVVLCTGGCSEPNIPMGLDMSAVKASGFSGPVPHSSQFTPQLEKILSAAPEGTGSVVVIGGGKSAQDIAAYLTSQGRKVSIVFETADAFLAAPIPLPYFIRKSRFLAVLSPHIKLQTKLERFLHNTKLGGLLVQGVWNLLTWSSLFSFSIPTDSPFRSRAHSLFWGIRTNDEGVGRPTGFFTFLKQGKIDVVAPARAQAYAPDVVILEDGRRIPADAIVLATGYVSSWDKLFDEETRQELGLNRQSPIPGVEVTGKWDYATLQNPPKTHPEGTAAASSMYRGIVPAKNLFNRDFAVNGALFTTNNGYVYETTSHWISSYLLGDKFLHLPSSVESALVQTHENAAWLRKRYPGMLSWSNESYSSGVAFWTWPQLMDELLEDMSLPNMRNCGDSYFFWPFKIIDLKEIENLHDERAENRLETTGHL